MRFYVDFRPICSMFQKRGATKKDLIKSGEAPKNNYLGRRTLAIVRVPEQTNHYYYNKYIIYNKENNKQKALLPRLPCYPTLATLLIFAVCVFWNMPEHAGTPEHGWWFSLVFPPPKKAPYFRSPRCLETRMVIGSAPSRTLLHAVLQPL